MELGVLSPRSRIMIIFWLQEECERKSILSMNGLRRNGKYQPQIVQSG